MDITFIRGEAARQGSRPESAPLERALLKHGHRVTLLLPLPDHADPGAMALAKRLVKAQVEQSGVTTELDVYTGRDKDGMERVYLAGRGELDDAIFGEAAASYLAQTDTVSDVVVGVGAAGGHALVALAAADEPAVRLLVTEGAELARPPLLAAEILFASSELERGTLEARIGAELGARPLRVLGPSLDPAEWNPLSDPHLASRFDPHDLRGKAKCKAELQHELALPVRPDVPLLGVVGKGDSDGGIDLLSRIGPDVLKNDVQLVVHVEGGDEVVGVLEELWDRWPDRLQIRTGRDESFMHRLVSASDALFVPVESGEDTTLALAAQRYGALPIVSRRAGIADVLVDAEPSLATGNGFLFDALDEAPLLAVFRRVAAAFREPDAFSSLGRRAMHGDRTLESLVKLVEHLCEGLLERKAAGEASA